MKKKKSVNPYFAVSVPVEMKARIRKYAKKNNTFITEIVLEAINEFFERRDNETGNTDQKRDTE